jgi:hypothetical protein
MRVWQFFWDLVLLGIIVLIATRVTVAMDRDRRALGDPHRPHPRRRALPLGVSLGRAAGRLIAPSIPTGR